MTKSSLLDLLEPASRAKARVFPRSGLETKPCSNDWIRSRRHGWFRLAAQLTAAVLDQRGTVTEYMDNRGSLLQDARTAWVRGWQDTCGPSQAKG